MYPKEFLASLLDGTGVVINGSNPWDPRVSDSRVYKRILKSGTLGAGESYMDGWWDCERLDELICRVMKTDLHTRINRDWRTWAPLVWPVLLNFTKNLPFVIGKRHYDIGNDLFEAMLGPTMAYSCSYWTPRATTLEQAQTAKYELICQKLGLRPNMTLLDIGCGWGGLLQHAVKHYCIKGVGITVSVEQVKFIREHYQNLDIEVLLQHYMQTVGQFDRVVSVGMLEHVGLRNYRAYYSKIRSLLTDDGFFLLHTIGGNRTRLLGDPWLQRYIFPNSHLPSLAQITGAAEPWFIQEHWQNIGAHYDKTLMAWHANFITAWPKLAHRYSERFRRMWEFYLLSCAGMFRARAAQVWQVVYSPKGVLGGYQFLQ